jgi:hypothetical protein
MKTVILIAFTALAVGCSTPKAWYCPGITPDQTRRDLAECQMFSLGLRSAPPAMNSTAINVNVNSYVSPYQDMGAIGYSAGYNIGAAVAIRRQREALLQACMEAKGYQLLPISQIPTNQPAK